MHARIGSPGDPYYRLDLTARKAAQMPTPLHREDLRSRLRGNTREQYTYLGGVGKGVAVAMAALVLISFMADFGQFWPL